jgi:DNA-binding response OmpR family regulator
MRILIIEDDSSVAEFIVGGLSGAGYEVTHARDGKEGQSADR